VFWARVTATMTGIRYMQEKLTSVMKNNF